MKLLLFVVLRSVYTHPFPDTPFLCFLPIVVAILVAKFQAFPYKAGKMSWGCGDRHRCS